MDCTRQGVSHVQAERGPRRCRWFPAGWPCGAQSRVRGAPPGELLSATAPPPSARCHGASGCEWGLERPALRGRLTGRSGEGRTGVCPPGHGQKGPGRWLGHVGQKPTPPPPCPPAHAAVATRRVTCPARRGPGPRPRGPPLGTGTCFVQDAGGHRGTGGREGLERRHAVLSVLMTRPGRWCQREGNEAPSGQCRCPREAWGTAHAPPLVARHKLIPEAGQSQQTGRRDGVCPHTGDPASPLPLTGLRGL